MRRVWSADVVPGMLAVTERIVPLDGREVEGYNE